MDGRRKMSGACQGRAAERTHLPVLHQKRKKSNKKKNRKTRFQPRASRVRGSRARALSQDAGNAAAGPARVAKAASRGPIWRVGGAQEGVARGMRDLAR